MRRERLAIRILGLAATVKGFAYALTEGPGCLVDVTTSRERRDRQLADRLYAVIARGRPLFVAMARPRARAGPREAALERAVKEASQKAGIMILRVSGSDLDSFAKTPSATTFDIAREVARRFDEIAHRLPPKPTKWEGSEDRFGIFKATAFALAAWERFRRRDLCECDENSGESSYG